MWRVSVASRSFHDVVKKCWNSVARPLGVAGVYPDVRAPSFLPVKARRIQTDGRYFFFALRMDSQCRVAPRRMSE